MEACLGKMRYQIPNNWFTCEFSKFLRVIQFISSRAIIANLNSRGCSLQVLWHLILSVFNPLAFPRVNWQQHPLKSSPMQSEPWWINMYVICTHTYIHNTHIQRGWDLMFTFRNIHGNTEFPWYGFWSSLMVRSYILHSLYWKKICF